MPSNSEAKLRHHRPVIALSKLRIPFHASVRRNAEAILTSVRNMPRLHKVLRTELPSVYSFCNEKATEFDVPLARILYHVAHPGVTGLCCSCSKPAKFINSVKGYRKFCGTVCAARDPDRVSKFQQSHSSIVAVVDRRLLSVSYSLSDSDRSKILRLIKLRLNSMEFRKALASKFPDLLRYCDATACALSSKAIRVLYHVLHSSCRVECSSCGCDLRFRNIRSGYGKYCRRCAPSSEEARASTVRNNMKKYGFHHHMHVSSIAKKVFDRCLHIKEVSAGDHKFRVRGYEDIAVRILNARGLNLEHLVDGHSGSCPSFRYRSPCGKERFYYPDFLIRQPKSKDVILEIKSCYTAGFGKKSMWDIIRRKAKAVELEGYRFVLWVIHDGKVILSTNAYRMSYSKMSRILTDRIR